MGGTGGRSKNFPCRKFPGDAGDAVKTTGLDHAVQGEPERCPEAAAGSLAKPIVRSTVAGRALKMASAPFIPPNLKQVFLIRGA